MQQRKQSPIQENYEYILMTKADREFIKAGGKLQTRKMNEQEEAWARKFEEMERAIRKGREDYATKAWTELNPSEELKAADIKRLAELCGTAEKANPLNAEARLREHRRYNAKKKKTAQTRKPKVNQYEAYDHQRNNGLTLDEDGEETERGITVSPEDGMIEALEAANTKKNRSLEKLVMDAKLSKEAKELLLAKTQRMTYEAMTYTFHGRQYMDLNYILKAPDGQLWVQDQHDRLQTLALYLKRKTSESFATHVEVYYPDQPVQIWIYQAGKRSNIEGMAIKWAA